MGDLAERAAALGEGGSCLAQRTSDNSWDSTTRGRSSDAPGRVDLVPVVVAVEHPRPDDPHVCSKRGSGDAASGANAEAGDVADDDWLAGCAARLVARHDLDVQATVLLVLRVQHELVAGIG